MTILHVIRNFFDKEPKIKERSTSGNLTNDERRYIAWAIRHKKCPCPDCKLGKFLEGPRGGCSQNVTCDQCGTKFNITFFYGDVLGERI